MKTYIIYIATLLAALALPANGQTGIPVTKAAPDAPAMPYKLSTTVIGNAHGTLAVTDNKEDGGGVVFVGNDTLVYGANNDNNTTVKLTLTLKANYIPRSDYPKAYRTNDKTTLVALTPAGESSAAETKVYTFRMPAYPVTVETAYALPVASVDTITLTATTADTEAVIALLPDYIPVTLANGHKDSLKVASGTARKSYRAEDNGGKAYDGGSGATNMFLYHLSALPDSLDEGNGVLGKIDNTLTALVPVVNKVQPLVPTDDDKGKDLVISGGGDHLNGGTGEGDQKPFDGTIEKATPPSLTIDESVKDATLTLKDVTVSGGDTPEQAKTEVKSGADLTIKVEGTSSLGKLVVNSGASVILDKAEGATLEGTSVSNDGTFRDSTATIPTVTGDGALSISGTLSGGGSFTTNTPVTLTASTTDRAGTTTFIWQKREADGSYKEVRKQAYKEDSPPIQTRSGSAATDNGIVDTYSPSTSATGISEYRCLIERTVTIPASGGSGEATTATTLLSTQPAKVEVWSDSDPEPVTSYTVTLPALEGFSISPAPGQHSVEEGYDFSFTLTPAEGNDTPAPTVTTSRGETLTPRPSDGLYVITGIYEDITVRFTSLPTANEEITPADEQVSVRGTRGGVRIQTTRPATATVHTLSGRPVTRMILPAGESRVGLPSGFYIIRVGNESRKAIVR